MGNVDLLVDAHARLVLALGWVVLATVTSFFADLNEKLFILWIWAR